MKIGKWNILTDKQLIIKQGESYNKAVTDIKVIMENKEKHHLCFNGFKITGKEIKLKNLVLLSGTAIFGGSTVTLSKDLTVGRGK